MSKVIRSSSYLTKKILKSAAKKGGAEAFENAMETAGFVVTIKDGWLIQEYKDGSIVKLKKLPKEKSLKLVLD